MTADAALHDYQEPQAETERSSTAVLLVHGIGVQPEHETLETYGGAIERLWVSFQNSGGEFTSRRRKTGDRRIIELQGPDQAVTIGEGHWDPVVKQAPGTLRLAYWIMVVAPASLIFSCRFPTRGSGQSWRRWIQRCALVVPTLALLTPMLMIVTVLTSAARLLRLVSDDKFDLVARTIGDAFHFTSGSAESREMIETVAERAQALAVGKDRLVVVAHSQGGAVAWRALRSDTWPSIPTEIVTLGSGHLRLLTLRSFRRPGLSRIALGLWNLAALLVSLFMGAALAYGAVLSVTDAATVAEAIGLLTAFIAFTATIYGIMIVVALGAPMLLAQRAVTKAISNRISESTHYWLDISSTRDVVPDGAVASDRAAILTVVNRRSILWDHTSYHENAPGGIAAIVDRICPARLQHHHQLIQDLRSERKAFSKRLLRCERTTEAQFAGDQMAANIPAGSVTSRTPELSKRLPPPPRPGWALSV